MKTTHSGYVIVSTKTDSTPLIHAWSFQHMRKDCIGVFVGNSEYDWKYWKKQGIRCIKCTQTTTIENENETTPQNQTAVHVA